MAVDRMQVYHELLYNNVTSFIDNVFPVARSIVDTHHWALLQRDFFTHARCQSPFYMDISKEFLDYLQQSKPALLANYPWLPELLHVEWMELHIDLLAFDWPLSDSLLTDEAMAVLNEDRLIQFSVPVWVLGYQWPVYGWQVNQDIDQEVLAPSFLLVWRDAEDERCQHIVSPVAAFLIDYMLQQRQFSMALLQQQLLDNIPALKASDAKGMLQVLLGDLCRFGLLQAPNS